MSQNYWKLEIKPCRLGSRIWDMKELISFIGEHLDYFFILVSRNGTVGWTEHWVAKVCTRYNAICSLAICIQICKFDPDCDLLLVLLGLMMMKSSKKWLTMSWLAEFLVGLLWSNLPLMTCYLRSCLSSIWAKKKFAAASITCCQISLKKWIFQLKKKSYHHSVSI